DQVADQRCGEKGAREGTEHRMEGVSGDAGSALRVQRRHGASPSRALTLRKQRCSGPRVPLAAASVFGLAYSAACAGAASPSQARQSASARAVIAFFLAIALSLPRKRPSKPSGLRRVPASSGGKRPKLMFIGWKERLPGSSSETM